VGLDVVGAAGVVMVVAVVVVVVDAVAAVAHDSTGSRRGVYFVAFMINAY
jgi:hypothetical protein